MVDDYRRLANVSPEELAAIGMMRIVASITVPLVKDGRLVAVMAAQQSTPRSWTAAEVWLVEEVAERIWAALGRARAEARRHESQSLLAAITEHAPIGIYLKDPQGRYELVNPRMAELMGRPAESILGRTAAELLPPALAARVAERDLTVIREDRLVSVEAQLAGRNARRSLLVMRFPVRTRPGEPPRVAGFDIDITAQKEAEAELERSREALHQSEKLSAMGSLLAGVSHELNNPLSIIIAQAVMLERKAAGTPLAERAGKIRDAADRSARIVQTFLAMARQKPPERRPVDLNG